MELEEIKFYKKESAFECENCGQQRNWLVYIRGSRTAYDGMAVAPVLFIEINEGLRNIKFALPDKKGGDTYIPFDCIFKTKDEAFGKPKNILNYVNYLEDILYEKNVLYNNFEEWKEYTK